MQFYGSAGMRFAESVRLAADGGYYLVGCEQPNCNETVLLRTDGAGDLLWSQNYADPDGRYTLGRDLLEKADGSLLLLQTWSSGAGGANLSDLLEINSDGSLRTTTPVPGGEGATNLRRLIPSGDGAGFVAAGGRSGPAGSSSMDLYLLRGTFADVPGEVNHAPQAMPDSFTLEAGQVLTHDHADSVLANDHDPDGHILTAHLVADVDHGSLTLAEDGGFSYVPAPDFDGTVSFSYRASDGELHSAETAVQITVLPACISLLTYRFFDLAIHLKIVDPWS